MRFLPFIGLLLAIILAPMPLGSNRPGPWSMLALWIGLMLVGWALVLWRDWAHLQVRPHYWRWPAIAFAVVIAWALVQAAPWTPAFLHHWSWSSAEPLVGDGTASAISAAPLATLTGVTRLLTYAGVFFLALQYGRERACARRLTTAFIVSAVIYAIYGLAVTFTGNETILWYQKWAYPESLTSTFVNRNSFATYCGIALVALVATLLAEARQPPVQREDMHGDPRERRFALLAVMVAAILVVLTALFLTQSRAGLISALAGLGVVLALHLDLFGRFRKETGRRARSRSLPLIVGGALALVAAISGGAVLDRLGDGGGKAGRAEIWERSVVALADAPLRGHGLGAFETIFYSYQDQPHVFAYPVDKAHNTYLELFVELGLPAGLLLIAIPVWCCIVILIGTIQERGGRHSVIALGASATVGLHSLVDFSAQIPAIAIVWIALLGVGFAQSLPSGVSAMVYVRQTGVAEAPTAKPHL